MIQLSAAVIGCADKRSNVSSSQVLHAGCDLEDPSRCAGGGACAVFWGKSP